MQRQEEPIPFLSSGLSYVVLTGLLMLMAYTDPTRVSEPKVALPPTAPAVAEKSSQQARVEAPQRPNSVGGDKTATGAAQPSSPASGASEAAPQPVKDEWSVEDITRGREQCTHLLAGVSADFEYLDPIKKGACGLPAPVRLKSVGDGAAKVAFDPPVQVNCRMVAALGGWVKATLQPKARERLKSEVVRIVGASGYSCRNIYNRPNAKLSQHALANAIDIGGFELASGKTVWILRGWGLTARDIKAAKARAALAAKKKSEAKAEDAKKESPSEGGKPVEADATQSMKKGGAGKTVSSVAQASLTASDMKIGKITDAETATGSPPTEKAKPTKEALFLRAIHGGACGAFGTVLGPEANDPHRNHFHLDLIERRGRGYCE